jgi:hypothetical protein
MYCKLAFLLVTLIYFLKATTQLRIFTASNIFSTSIPDFLLMTMNISMLLCTHMTTSSGLVAKLTTWQSGLEV